jgi:hypothetical protein
MRLWHLVAAVLFVALLLSISRDEVGRVALIVFFTGLAEVFLGTTALMLLFRTVGGIGEAHDATTYIEAVSATLLVILIASLLMNGVLWVGVTLVQNSFTY